MNIKDIIKKQTTVVALAIVLVALTLIGVSYAIFFDVKANEKNQIITAGTLKLTLATSNDLASIAGDSLVMINEVGLESTPLTTLTVANTDSNLPAAYSIYLDIEPIDNGIMDYVTVSLDGSSYFKVIGKETITDDEKTYYKIDSDILEAGATGSTKDLRLWLDEDLITEDIKQNITINLYIVSEVAEESGSITVEDIILYSKQGEGTPNFENTSCTAGSNDNGNCDEETVGLYCWDVDTNLQCTETSANKTYFYRGDVTDNYVEFAGFYWRIIRINENGSIRMIYQGRTKDEDGNELEIENLDEETQIGQSIFNAYYDKAEYVGFKYTIGETRGFTEKSKILETIELWYTSEKNELKKYEEFLDIESGFCGDRKSYTDEIGTTEGGGIGATESYYGAYIRLGGVNPTPTFSCSDSDLYTANNSSKGNKALTYPIGLITADEVAFAGGRHRTQNSGYYLRNKEFYWTMSPMYYAEDFASIYKIGSNGSLMPEYTARTTTTVRPVINVNIDDLTISGNGTIQEPYEFSK